MTPRRRWTGGSDLSIIADRQPPPAERRCVTGTGPIMADSEAPPPAEQFVSESITPDRESFDAAAMSRGEPGLPAAFTWRGRRYVVAKLLAAWKSTGQDRGEKYLRRHWNSAQTTPGESMTLYCQRQAKNPKRPRARWWIYSVRT